MNETDKAQEVTASVEAETGSSSTAVVPVPSNGDQDIMRPVSVRNTCLLIIAVLLSLAAMKIASPICIPLVMGAMFSYALTPVVNRLVQLHIPRTLAAAVVMLGVAGGFGAVVYSLGDEVVALIDGVPEVAQKLRRDLRNNEGEGPATTIEKVQKAATELERAAQITDTEPKPDKGVTKVQIEKPKFNVREYLLPGTLGIATAAGNIAVVFFIAFFVLAAGDSFRRKLVKIAGPTLTKKKITLMALEDINRHIQRYLLVQVFTSSLVGLATWIAFIWIGVDHAAVWGLVAFVFNFIPYVGSIITTGAAMLVGFAQSGSVDMALLIGGAGLVINILEGYVLTPMLTSHANRMSPVVIVAGVLAWGWLWGIWGLFLAVPILVVIKVVCDRVEDFNGVGELLGQ